MALSFHITLVCSIFFFFMIYPSIAKTSSNNKPKALVLPVTKDSSTKQYLTQLSQRTPLVPIKLTVDLGAPFLWANCDVGYVSSTYKPARCGSAQCSLADTNDCRDCFEFPPGPGCFNNTCRLYPENTINGQTLITGVVSHDTLSLQSTNGFNPSKFVTVPKSIFVCSESRLGTLDDLASGVTGMAGLGRTKISLPSQFASAFRFPKKFAICLSSSTTSNGVMFFGDGPYVLLPGLDVSKNLIFTPLIRNPVSTASSPQKEEPSSEYFIRVKSVKINGKTVPLNKTLLTIDSAGFGGTKISTVKPYTELEASIYNKFISVFEKQVGNHVPKVAPVAPFGLCYKSKSFDSTRVGAAVPPIDLVLQKKSVFWRIFGANSMVQVSNEVVCVGFVKAREDFPPKTPIIIGAHQLEDNLLQFDLDHSRLGFSSTLLSRQTTCANFNFTSNA
ncbi:basic 7S globulin-like [Quillaja saponaria]|uniref:Basic 7S globulin-like n=1 Tax=Quillaja saponaria TaxID=32244 RepID=A0AAD7LB98_QUISA|nr:basic 7S globulin-like [Quillaja saponaria]